MKFTIKRNAFIKKLTDVQRAISSKTAIEILTGLKITVTENSITLTGSDSDISIENEISTDDSNYELLLMNLDQLFYQPAFLVKLSNVSQKVHLQLKLMNISKQLLHLVKQNIKLME